MNHEYTDDGLLHAGGMTTWTAEKVRKAQAAHGVSVIEVGDEGRHAGRWCGRRSYARRITAYTPFAVGGPARGPSDDAGPRPTPRAAPVLGTLNNCAARHDARGAPTSPAKRTSCDYFNGGDTLSPHERRWGMRKGGSGYRWHEHDERFDAGEASERAEPLRLGRRDRSVRPERRCRSSAPRSAALRTRARWVARDQDGRAVVYSGEDARFEYIYKFVSRDRIAPGGAQGQRDAARQRHALRRALQRRWQRPVAAARAWRRAAHCRQRLCRPGRGA